MLGMIKFKKWFDFFRFINGGIICFSLRVFLFLVYFEIKVFEDVN